MAFHPIRLGVNIDHVATLRQVRGTIYPDPIQAAMLAAQAGADGITLHLREDRRHIQDRDLKLLKEISQVPINLEMAVTDEMIDHALQIRPAHCCLVPEKRQELTTEGGLDVVGQMNAITKACQKLTGAGIEVSLFIDADYKQIEAAKKCGAPTIEIHTGCYAEAYQDPECLQELRRIEEAALFAHDLGLKVNAGHGLNNQNVQPIAAIAVIHELNIGHALIAHAVFVGLEKAVKEMKQLMVQARMLI